MIASFRPTRRWALKLAGDIFDEWTSVEINRDIEDLTGSFTFELRDAQRSGAAHPFATLASYKNMVTAGLEAEIRLDGKTILKGWVDRIAPHAGEDGASVTIDGSDKARDLIDGAATVDGPSEYRNETVDQVGKEIVKPYGLDFRAEVDVGQPFERYTIEPGETALSAIEKGLRQRGALLTSDGVGAVVMTKAGKERAGELRYPGNVTSTDGEFSIEGRHSEYVVKGQAEKAQGKRGTARLDATAAPLVGDPTEWINEQLDRELGGVAIEGRQKDAEMVRYRPLVTLGRTQLTAEGAQTQAEWMERTAKGRSEELRHRVKGYHDEDGKLWRPNTLAPVSDDYQDVHRDMLIAGTVYRYSADDGEVTELRITSPDAYDTEPVAGRRTNRTKQKKTGASTPLDSTANPL